MSDEHDTKYISIQGKYTLNYKIKIGKGSYSTVYLGHVTSDKSKRKLAIKVIDTKHMKQQIKQIMDEEIKIMEQIKINPHPNIVECLDIIIEQNLIYIILEYCDSGDLSKLLKKPIKEKYVQFYFSQLANGLKYLSDHHIMHRDMKPSNILLSNHSKVLKIADFGFAKNTEPNILYNTICGSPLYMAPEIILHSSYDDKIDLWSVGMILYQMLYTIHPYKKCKTIPELMDAFNKIKIDVPPKLQIGYINEPISDECLDLLSRLLKTDVSERIKWNDFFDHVWITNYKVESKPTPQHCIDYKEKIISTSVGSLLSQIDENYIDKFIKPNNNNTNTNTNTNNNDNLHDDKDDIYDDDIDVDADADADADDKYILVNSSHTTVTYQRSAPIQIPIKK